MCIQIHQLSSKMAFLTGLLFTNGLYPTSGKHLFTQQNSYSSSHFIALWLHSDYHCYNVAAVILSLMSWLLDSDHIAHMQHLISTACDVLYREYGGLLLSIQKKCDYNLSSQFVHSIPNGLVSNRSITAFCWIDYTRPWSRYWTPVQIFCLESIDEKVQGLYWCLRPVPTKWVTSCQGTKGDMAHWTFQKSIENKGISQGKNSFGPWIRQ